MEDTMTEMKQKETGELERYLGTLYEKLTMLGMKEFEIIEGNNFLSTVTVVDVEKKRYVVPLCSTMEENEAVAKVMKILREKRGLAIITICEVGVMLQSENEPLSPLEDNSFEFFIAAIESMVMNKIKVWKINRDENGRTIFPLVQQLESPDFKSAFTQDYFSVS